MLILTRKSDEAILIGDDIVIRVLDIKSGQVRLGIEAPREKRIYREELYRRIVEENLSSARSEPLVFNEIKEVFKKK